MKPIVIAGPTSVGKTDLSLYLAEKIGNAEIVSCDSMQIYKDMDIGTDKVSKEIREQIPHHMIDIITPREKMTLGRFIDLASFHVKNILNKGKVPIIVGGTTLYMHFLLYDLPIFSQKDKNLIKDLEKKSNKELYNIILSKNKKLAKKISLQDRKRLLRYAELLLKGENINLNFWSDLKERFDFTGIILLKPRKDIFSKIEKRVENQIKKGLVEEVNFILNKYDFKKELDLFFSQYKHLSFNEIYKSFQTYFDKYPALQAHSYKEIIFYLYGILSLDEAKAWIIKSTKNYAKRQIRWLRKYLNFENWICIDVENKSFDYIFDILIDNLD